MRKIGAVGVGIVVVIVVICLFLSTVIIPAGYNGIIYSLNGGIKDKVLTQGFHLVSPIVNVSEYSVSTEQGALSTDKREGSEEDDSFNVPTKDGKTVNVDLEYSYSFPADTLPELFTKFKGQSGKDIEQGFMRSKLKAWTAEVTSQYSVLDIYGEKRQQLNTDLQKHLNNKFKVYYINIETANLSKIELDQATSNAIQKRINAQQELEQQKIETEKAKQIQQRKVIEAETSAKEKIIQAEADAEANRKINSSLTPELLKLKELQARFKHGWVTVQTGQAIVDVK